MLLMYAAVVGLCFEGRQQDHARLPAGGTQRSRRAAHRFSKRVSCVFVAIHAERVDERLNNGQFSTAINPITKQEVIAFAQHHH